MTPSPLPSRPVLRYFGSKWRLAPAILQHFPQHTTYVEPFGGGASVLLRKPRAPIEIYNDTNSDVVNLMRVLRDPIASQRLRELCILTPFAADELAAAFGDDSADPIERARLLLVRSWFGLGHDTATSGRKQYSALNTRITEHRGSYAGFWANWPEQVPAFVERLSGVIIENKDALDVISRFDSKTTLIYADPPYVSQTRGAGGYEHEMTDEQHAALAEVLRAADGFVVLSGYACELYDTLYRDWTRIEIDARAHNLGKSDTARKEVLWMNAACASALPLGQQDLFSVLSTSVSP
ncbi:MAG: DNA adenine methylase [Acidobacteriaceae bacterium]